MGLRSLPAVRGSRAASLRLFLHRAAGAAGGRLPRRHLRGDPQGPRQDLRLAGALLQAGRRDLPRAVAHLLRGDAAAAGVAALQRADAARAIARPASGAEGQGTALSHAQHDLFSVVRKHFVDERIRTLFTSYMHVITTENVPGAGIVFPADLRQHRQLHAAGRRRASLGRLRWRAWWRRAEATVITDAEVKEIEVKGGRATGVMLDDGRFIGGSKFVASAIDFPMTVRWRARSGSPSRCARRRKPGTGATTAWSPCIWRLKMRRATAPQPSIPTWRAPTTSSSAWTTSTKWRAASTTAPPRNFPRC